MGRSNVVCARRKAGLLHLVLVLTAARVDAQHDTTHGLHSGSVRIGAQAVALMTSMQPTPERRRLTESYLTQPMAALIARRGGLAARITLNAEALTLDRGELTTGAWGEGFVDRRHPHTFFHEVVLELSRAGDCRGVACRAGLFAGKGFVPFGSDDPMSRPFAAYPVNHHLAQLLERAVAGGQAGLGPFTLELSLFNGDEPVDPWDWPKVSRFGDSWAGRLEFEPIRGISLAASYADVTSPEARTGSAPDQEKWHVGVRGERSSGFWRFAALVEWARTEELDGFFRFESRLGEGAVERGPHRFAYRFEHSDRPEEERQSAYRTFRPQLDNAVVGITRWTLHTIRYGYSIPWRRGAAEPFIEATRGDIEEVTGGLFNPEARYGRSTVTRISAGIKLGWAMDRHRMGRYGVHDNSGTH
jgi:hypothetical protein